jgi:hypothetical protein
MKKSLTLVQFVNKIVRVLSEMSPEEKENIHRLFEKCDSGNHCGRPNGLYRAWFDSREEAEAFERDPANVHYHGDVAHHCAKCGFWHVSRINWLFPEWNTLEENAIVN